VPPYYWTTQSNTHFYSIWGKSMLESRLGDNAGGDGPIKPLFWDRNATVHQFRSASVVYADGGGVLYPHALYLYQTGRTLGDADITNWLASYYDGGYRP